MRKTVSTLVSIFLILHLATSGTFGQTAIPRTSVINGTVIDASTGEPLHGTNVFIDNSLMGAATDQDGKFTINKVPQGTFQLVASFIGYKPVKKRVRLESDITYTIDFQLTPDILQLEDIIVTYERPKDWEKDLLTFQEGLLGTTDNADKCTILNAEFLRLERDTETDIFEAAADRILRIENRALGYVVNLLLEEFQIRRGVIKMSYMIKFEEIIPENNKEAKNWEKAREKTYQGSFQHFLASFSQGTHEKEGFTVDRYSNDNENIRIVTKRNYNEFISQGRNQYEKILHFERSLRVRNLEAGMNYYTRMIRGSDTLVGAYREESLITLMRDQVPVSIDGTLPAPYLIAVRGFWSQARIADKLPFEYSPASK
ncbi:carboxypeptidase-like regulatory domain-containing protein [candidate division KSB1 bacterium]